MEFIIERTSHHGNQAPCEEAHEREVVEDDSNWGPDGWITEQIKVVRWFIDINTPEELVALEKKYGEIIISSCDAGPTLEIYDDYRE